jgi:hypothetical protein
MIEWSKVKAFIAKWWKALVWALALVVAIIVGRRIVAAAKRVLVGKVSRPGRFDVIDERTVAIRTEEGWVAVPVPKGYKSSDVVAVQMTPAMTATVEVKHAHKNRR